MNGQKSIRSFRRTPFAAALALLLVLVAAMPVGAETTGSVTVSASVANQTLSMTICDSEANFGSGLDSRGAAPTGTTDAVVATAEGTEPGQGVFYRWTPSCQANGQGWFLTVESNISWNFSRCMGPNTGTNPDLTDQDLRWSISHLTTYADVLGPWVGFFPSCPGTSAGPFSGNDSFSMYYYLRIDDHVGNGTFATTTTWTVVPE
jgi:hypothetical protein